MRVMTTNVKIKSTLYQLSMFLCLVLYFITVRAIHEVWHFHLSRGRGFRKTQKIRAPSGIINQILQAFFINIDFHLSMVVLNHFPKLRLGWCGACPVLFRS